MTQYWRDPERFRGPKRECYRVDPERYRARAKARREEPA